MPPFRAWPLLRLLHGIFETWWRERVAKARSAKTTRPRARARHSPGIVAPAMNAGGLGVYITHSRRARERAESFMMGLLFGLAGGIALGVVLFRLGAGA
jgi:hypothetical protein